MGKLDQYMQGRTEGMELALRIVKDKGIEELEKEIKFRSTSGISLNVTSKELTAASENIKEMMLKTFTVLSIASIHDVFGFGKKRCQKYMDRMNEGVGYLMQDMATWEDYANAIKEQIGIDFDVCWEDYKKGCN